MTLNISGYQLSKLEINGLTLRAYNSEGTIEYSLKRIRNINCSNNLLKTLPKLPNGLKELDCSDNQLQTLSDLPLFLQELDCSYNRLQKMSDLPKSLLTLTCRGNQLSNLPNLPNSLVKLNCYDNNLSVLPILPKSIITLWCSKNPLVFIPPVLERPSYSILPPQFSDLFTEENYPIYSRKYQTYRYVISHLVLVSNILPTILSNGNWWFPVNV